MCNYLIMRWEFMIFYFENIILYLLLFSTHNLNALCRVTVGYSDLIEIAINECFDGCDIALLTCQSVSYLSLFIFCFCLTSFHLIIHSIQLF